jgi:hypothetical protein
MMLQYAYRRPSMLGDYSVDPYNSTSCVQYSREAIPYEKFDAVSTERFKLGEWMPRSITGGKMQRDPKNKVVTLHSTSKSVTIRR